MHTPSSSSSPLSPFLAPTNANANANAHANTNALAHDAALLASALQRSSAALSTLALSVSDSLAEAANVSHTAATLVHLGARSVAAQVASPAGPVSQAADLVARADQLAALLADKIMSLHEDVRAINLALDLLESRVSQASTQAQAQLATPPPAPNSGIGSSPPSVAPPQ